MTVSPNLSDEARTLLKLIADGEWHPYAPVVDAVCATVPPGKAYRRYQAVTSNRRLHNGPRKGPELTEDEQIRSGRRAIVTDLVSSLRKRYVEIRDTDDGREIRRRAEIVPVARPARRRAADDARPRPEPAPEYEPPPPPSSDADPTQGERDLVTGCEPAAAFFSEKEVRAMVADEVAAELDAALDDFGSGMQRWFTERFAELERLVTERRPPPAGNLQLPRDLRRRSRGR